MTQSRDAGRLDQFPEERGNTGSARVCQNGGIPAARAPEASAQPQVKIESRFKNLEKHDEGRLS